MSHRLSNARQHRPASVRAEHLPPGVRPARCSGRWGAFMALPVAALIYSFVHNYCHSHKVVCRSATRRTISRSRRVPLAVRVPPPGRSWFHPARPPTVTVVAGGMPGWQIALIAAAAALVAAAVAVLLDRAWAARKAHATTA
jgi:hypothetical protein